MENAALASKSSIFVAKFSKSAVPKLKAPEKTDREIHTSNRLILLLTLTPGLMAAVTV